MNEVEVKLGVGFVTAPPALIGSAASQARGVHPTTLPRRVANLERESAALCPRKATERRNIRKRGIAWRAQGAPRRYFSC
jgi:hypothetical protein